MLRHQRQDIVNNEFYLSVKTRSAFPIHPSASDNSATPKPFKILSAPFAAGIHLAHRMPKFQGKSFSYAGTIGFAWQVICSTDPAHEKPLSTICILGSKGVDNNASMLALVQMFGPLNVRAPGLPIFFAQMLFAEAW